MSTFFIHKYFFLLLDKALYYAFWWTALIIFISGIVGFLANLNNFIRILISIEILYVSLSCFCIATGLLFASYVNFIYAIFFVFFAAIEGAVLLLFCVQIYYIQNEIYVERPLILEW